MNMSSTSTPKRPPSTATAPFKQTSANNSNSSPGNTANSTTATPNRSPSRMAADGNVAPSSVAGRATTASSLNRARSVRNSTGTPVSARAAARKTGPNDNDDAKAELQSKLDEVQEKLREAERAVEESQKQAAVLQVRLDEAVRDQGRLEEHAHEHAERVEELENERRESVRARREFEQIYEAERAQMMREKEEAEGQQEEMQNAMFRLKETLAQREMRDRTTGLEDERRPSSVSRNGSFRSGNASPTTETGHFAPPSSVQRSDSRSSSRLVMQKDKIIEGLRLELAEAQIKLVELENQGGGRVHELQREIYEVKMQNARLMEDNESFQLLLSEKTLNGDLVHSELLRPPSRSPNQGTSLADELEGQQDDTEHQDGSEPGDRRAQAEVNSLRDQNKALTLYINNIISRLLQHEQFEQILDKTPDLMAGPGALSRRFAAMDTEKDLPPPPPPKADEPGVAEEQPQQQDSGIATGLLQRARSVMGGRPKPRPSSVYQNITQSAEGPEPRVTENPNTAPSIPLGRSASTRGHRRANSDWPAASVVNNMMYRGPSPALQGPTSPGLSSPTLTSRNSFFGAGAMGGRVTSGGSTTSTAAIPSITEQEPSPTMPPNKENIPHPSATNSSAVPLHRRHASTGSASYSVSDPETLDGPPAPLPLASSATSAAASTSSPPRSTTSSSGDRDRGDNRSGAIMMGSKPRPLRLVQEAAGGGVDDAEKARKAGNRGSWFGWMNKGVSAALPHGVAGAGAGNEPAGAAATGAGAAAGGSVAQ